MRPPFARAFFVVALCGVAALAVPSCGGATEDGGTDSNTHWLRKCSADSDCGTLSCLCGVCTRPCNETASCADLGETAVCGTSPSTCASASPVCVACGDGPGRTPCNAEAGSPLTGGTCPAGVVEGDSCDGSVEQCWTPCSTGLRGQYACSEGTWTAGKGLFPCGDAGSAVVGGVCPADVGPGVPCSGSGGCRTSCAGGGYQTYWSCTDGQWVGTFGLVPCPDAAAPVGDVACPANVASGAPCDSSVPMCSARCVSGLQGRFYCSGAQWVAGHGLFPCGDAG
jgi:hypothetical protein